jgi:hypothetical protein
VIRDLVACNGWKFVEPAKLPPRVTQQQAPVTVATFEGAYRHMAQLGDRFDLLIVDEVHHFGAGLRDEALEMAIAGARLGLTATPPRDAGAVARLAELVGPTVFELAVADLAGPARLSGRPGSLPADPVSRANVQSALPTGVSMAVTLPFTPPFIDTVPGVTDTARTVSDEETSSCPGGGGP